ncbi:NACHT domain-containing protein [Plantactinospora sp. S1510]|uniref:NACHT domain-containing protein n=1 Tax=Plantactinospora alkalitolerans TaxID=2789879 RepID=A0ABS0GTB8_9ACTN|nr:NACHT domain-containing protein [Plantactinospora alkalitolerans]MBF9129442.1 NACHT domain-containing protein [Plantactinospora alkalitolerans]
MAVVETLTVSAGASVAKWIIGEWVGDGLKKELSSGFVDILAARVPDFLQRRRIERQMDQIAEAAADKLSRLIEAEFQTLDEGEKTAAAHAAADTLTASLGTADLPGMDYDPARLKEHVINGSVHQIAKYGLSGGAYRLYQLILSESSSYIVEVASTLPRFTQTSTIELLRRESALIQMVREILEKVPDPRAVAQLEAAATAEFETNYRRYIARRLDRLELFGLSASEFSSRYALSVAYISLSVRANKIGSNAGTDESHFDDSKHGDFNDRVQLRVDDAVGSTRRVFVRGAAGSGKTTLLQWIAVRSARNEFEGPMRDWNGTISFFLQLRRFAKGPLPAPGDFLSFAGSGMLERAPSGWVIEQLASGRATLLVDGVDEVPESDRTRVRKWLDELIAAYPDCRYVVTSRPAAVSEDWLSGEGFGSLELLPMSMSDIREFVAHWHHAAARNGGDQEQLAQLSRYQAVLTETIAASRQIRSLAATPLLCAMLCALNRDRRTQLPKDRVELYRIALEMLLERRDLEREVDVSEDPVLSLPEKLILLRELAYWLVLNEQSDAEYQSALERFSYRLRFMHGVRASGERVLKHLLVRSGLLREPVQGRIDFIHRTFQEYLAALEVAELDHISMLVRKASEDNWREVVILTAGTCHSRQKSELIEGLLRRGREEVENRHTLYLLAVACLETAREVPPQLAEEIGNCLNELLPPRNVTEAKELASAGDLALSRLGRYVKAKAAEAAACIRAACLIGGEASLPVLAAFSKDQRITLQRELIRCWSLHDQPLQYSTAVLGDAPLVSGVASISDPSLLPYVNNLKKLKALELTIRGVPTNLDILKTIPELTLVDVRNNPHINSVSFLAESVALEHLDLERCFNLEDISPVAALTNLVLLDVSKTKVEDISALERMTKLNWLSLSNCKKIVNWEPLRSISNVRIAQFSYCKGLESLDYLANWQELSSLYVGGTNISSLGPVGKLPKLSKVYAMSCPHLKDISSVAGSRTIEVISIGSNEGITSIESLADMPALTYLYADACPNLEFFPSSPNWPMLRSFSVDDCEHLSDISFLAGSKRLRSVSISDTRVSDLSPLRQATQLSHLYLDGCSGIQDLSALGQLPNLSSINFMRVPHIDLTQLGDGFKQGLQIWVTKGQMIKGAEAFQAAGGRLRVFR